MSSIINPEEYHSARRSGLFEVISFPPRPAELEWMVIRAKRDQFLRTKQLMGASFVPNQSIAN